MHSLKTIKNHPVQTQGTRKHVRVRFEMIKFLSILISKYKQTCAEHMRTLNKRQSTDKGIYMQNKIGIGFVSKV